MELKTYDRIGENVYSGRISNGLPIYVIQKKDYIKSVAVFATNYGGADRRFKLSDGWHDTPAGIAHFLEHKMFEMPDGTNALTTLSDNGASPNAFTSDAQTAYHFSGTDKFEENLRSLLKFVTTPCFTDESVKKEQGIIGQEIRMTEDDPDYCLYQNLMRALYSENPVRDSVAGTVESIAEITPEVLYYCHKAFYNPANMVLTVAGDVDPERVAEIAEEVLSPEKGEAAERDYGAPESDMPAEKSVSVRMDVALPLFAVGAKLKYPKDGAERFRREIIGDFAMDMLAGESSKLYSKLYAEGLINDRFFAGTNWFPDGGAVIFGGESRDADAVCDAVFAEADRIIEEGPDEALFERLKKASIGERIRSLDSLYGACARWADGHFGGYDPFEADLIVEAVTPEDVSEFLKNEFSREKMARSTVVPTDGEK